jgi:hypothetical protein
MAVLPYKDSLLLLSRYLQQLVMESLGKEFDLDGNRVCIIPFSSHSLYYQSCRGLYSKGGLFPIHVENVQISVKSYTMS